MFLFLNSFGKPEWTSHCVRHNVTAGTVVVAAGSGRGGARMVPFKYGPFVWLDV